METKELYQKIYNVRKTLDLIEVKGSDNLNKLLGCIWTLDDILKKAGEEQQDVQDKAE